MRMLGSLCEVDQGRKGGGCEMVLVNALGMRVGEVGGGMGVENVVVFGEGGWVVAV